ncbi:hypothetical protein QBC46DRAFT_451926 [Diplogelasinospora grovesii]|uniref:Uncharacterized protein n=1 Tax=Diplogelasinospora grovesii TaxID=303347 RepID=A0AAN6N478_9PEZI|nr:hypothetical protein QBC46DRAFT_451926 [Diplogelasinospora grovesii]
MDTSCDSGGSSRETRDLADLEISDPAINRVNHDADKPTDSPTMDDGGAHDESQAPAPTAGSANDGPNATDSTTEPGGSPEENGDTARKEQIDRGDQPNSSSPAKKRRPGHPIGDKEPFYLCPEDGKHGKTVFTGFDVKGDLIATARAVVKDMVICLLVCVAIISFLYSANQ